MAKYFKLIEVTEEECEEHCLDLFNVSSMYVINYEPNNILKCLMMLII